MEKLRAAFISAISKLPPCLGNMVFDYVENEFAILITQEMLYIFQEYIKQDKRILNCMYVHGTLVVIDISVGGCVFGMRPCYLSIVISMRDFISSLEKCRLYSNFINSMPNKGLDFSHGSILVEWTDHLENSFPAIIRTYVRRI